MQGFERTIERGRTALIGLVLGLAVMTLYGAVREPVWRASVVLRYHSSPAFDDATYGAPDVTPTDVYTEMRLIPTRPVLKRASRAVPFPISIAELGEGLSGDRPGEAVDLVEVTYSGRDRRRVPYVANAVADAVVAERAATLVAPALARVRALERQRERISAQLEAAEADLAAGRREDRVLDLAAEADARVRRLAELRAERTELAVQLDALTRFAALTGGATVAAARAVGVASPYFGDEMVSGLTIRLLRAERARAAALVGRTAEHPEVVELDRRIEHLRSQLVRFASDHRSRVAERLAVVDRSIREAESVLRAVPARETRDQRRVRRAALLGALETALTRRLEEARLDASVDRAGIEVVERAVVPDEPVDPGRTLRLAMGAVVGLLGGLGFGRLRAVTARRIRSDEAVERTLGAPVLARISHVPGLTRRSPRPDTLIAHHDGTSVPAESYRTLRTHVRYTRAGEGSRELVVTSPGPEEGKSLTAANLAVTFAQQGNRTLLIDADLRRSVQHEAFDVEREPGLADVLVGRAEGEAALRETDVEGLTLLPSGFSPPNPAELLDSERMRALVADARERYDAVVIDTPPALAVTDASVLARQVEGTVVVIRAEQTDRRAAEEALEQLHRVGGEVVGLVFNDADRDGYRGYYYYGYAGDGEGTGTSRWKRLVPFS